MASRGGQLSKEDRMKVYDMCSSWDTDGDGAISRAELGKALQEIFPTCSEKDVEDLLRTVDINDDGVIQYREFLAWMELPAQDKLSFGDHLRSVVLQGSTTRRRKASFVPLRQEQTATSRTPSASSSGGLPEEFLKLLRLFTHALLERFKVVSSFGDKPVPQVVPVLENVDRSLADEVKLECTTGNIFSIRAAPSIMIEHIADPPGIDQILEEVDCLAEIYEEILLRFCDAMSQKEGAAINKLQLRPITCVNLSLSVLPLDADITWAAMALAVARLPVQSQSLILSSTANTRIEVVDDSSTTTQLAEALAAKIDVASQSLLLDKEGRLPPMKGKFDWIRKDNSPSCRLFRLQTFMLTQRAISADCYALTRSAPIVKLASIKEMIRGTQIKTIAPGAPAPSTRGSKETRVLLPTQAVGLADATVMEVAQLLEKKGRRVAAVSAASAYKRGGGASTGGRHALEEAWCTMSTLFISLQTLESKPTWHVEACGSYGTKTTDFMTHIPTLGCVVSPAVEIFREPTSQGYGFLPKPVKLSAVISVAMFNRNPGVSDSPLDSPDDPGTYISETQQKFEAVVVAAIELGIQDLVIPDAGCGVFQNDPLVVGGCLGAVLRKYKGHLENVIVVGNTPSFFDSCQRVFDGGDPRPSCPERARCKKLADKTHITRFLHTDDSSGSLDVALKELVENPEVIAKPACRYGIGCRIKDPKHLECFKHADVVATAEANPKPDFNVTRTSSDSPQPGSADTRPICRFGEKCYDKNSDHLARYAHPWKVGGESAEEAKARKDIQDIHAILDNAKNSEWDKVKVALQKRPDLVNLRPEQRKFNLLHAATFQVNGDLMEWLIDTCQADPTLRTKDGETLSELYLEVVQKKPPKNDAQKKRDDLLLGWLKKLQTERITLKDYYQHYFASPPSTAPAISQEERVSGARMAVKNSLNPDLNGIYVELRESTDSCPIYRKKGSGVNHYLFHYTGANPSGYRQHAWVINTEIVDGGGLAYLLTSLPISDPSQKAHGEAWKVLYRSIITSSFHLDSLMRVDPLPSVGYMQF